MRTFNDTKHDNHNMILADVASHLDDFLIPLMGVTTLSLVMYQKNHPMIALFSFSVMGIFTYVGYLLLTFMLNYIAKKVMDVAWAAISVWLNNRWFQFRVWLVGKLRGKK